jgi:UDP-N-acetylglucosamine 2-epimerase
VNAPITRLHLDQIDLGLTAVYVLSTLHFSNLIKLQKPLGFNDHSACQVHNCPVLFDIGSIIEEYSFVNFRPLNFRKTVVRFEVMEEGSLIMLGLVPECILQGC